ncbi:MAG: hypothetical protein FWD89_00280 [Firmicutes bacterium]|nr:hypothetical protein [Bacillota bacterium]
MKNRKLKTSLMLGGIAVLGTALVVGGTAFTSNVAEAPEAIVLNSINSFNSIASKINVWEDGDFSDMNTNNHVGLNSSHVNFNTHSNNRRANTSMTNIQSYPHLAANNHFESKDYINSHPELGRGEPATLTNPLATTNNTGRRGRIGRRNRNNNNTHNSPNTNMGTNNHTGTGLNTNTHHNGDFYHISFRQEELREANQALRRAQRELNDQVQQSNQLVAQMKATPNQNLSKEQRDNIASHAIVLNKAKEILKHDVTEFNVGRNNMTHMQGGRGNHTAEQKANVELMILSAEKNLAALEAGNCSIRAINHELKQAIGHINTNQTTNQMTSNNTAMNNTDNTHFRGIGRRNHTRNNMDQTSVNNTGLNTGTDFNSYNNNQMMNFDNMGTNSNNNTVFSSASNTTDTTNQNQTTPNTTDGMTGTHNITPRHNTGRHTGTTNTSGTTMGYAQLCKKGC